MVQRLFADVITWRDLVYEYSWAKSPMISGYDSPQNFAPIVNSYEKTENPRMK